MFLYMLLLKKTWVFERMHVCYKEHRIHHLSSLGPRAQGGGVEVLGGMLLQSCLERSSPFVHATHVCHSVTMFVVVAFYDLLLASCTACAELSVLPRDRRIAPHGSDIPGSPVYVQCVHPRMQVCVYGVSQQQTYPINQTHKNASVRQRRESTAKQIPSIKPTKPLSPRTHACMVRHESIKI